MFVEGVPVLVPEKPERRVVAAVAAALVAAVATALNVQASDALTWRWVAEEALLATS